MKRIVLLNLIFLTAVFISCSTDTSGKIDRFALVTRHTISHSEINPLNSLTVGNGEFAYTADITGMQTFPGFYEKGIPLGTQSQWGWHSFPNPGNYTLDDVMKNFSVGSDSIPYVYQFLQGSNERKIKASQWLRENPHRIHLGLIGLEIYKNDTALCSVEDIEKPVQQLNLWTGELKSRFKINGVPVEVTTFCHQELDQVSFRVNSELLKSGRLKINIRFPYGNHGKFSPAYDFSDPDKHSTAVTGFGKRSVQFKRQLDNESHFISLHWENNARIEKVSEHEYRICPSGQGKVFSLNCHFSQTGNSRDLPGFAKTEKNNKILWKHFWESGAAVDFSQCTDPRASELERRIVLSQYLTKIQCAGSLPPQETGLTYNSWFGKFHLEMHWWHAMHFVLWNRGDLIGQQLEYYFNILDKARHTAEIQGYAGVRWPKMTDPHGRESPGTINPFLIWQQPHVIYLSEALYQCHQMDKAILEKYKKLVFATADFMAAYARFDSLQNRYILGPALIPAQERFDPVTTINPPFELAYWYWGLQTAQQWRTRLGMEKKKYWQDVLDKLADLPVKDSLYLFAENAPDSYTNPVFLTDHPIVLAITGFLPETKKINRNLLEKTLEKTEACWNWESCWGWDFPLAAMTATRLDQPEKAIDFLLMDTPKNRYLMNGHNYQDTTLTIYLPGNGALLSATALLCTYQNRKGGNGFPDNGKWKVKAENFISFPVEIPYGDPASQKKKKPRMHE